MAQYKNNRVFFLKKNGSFENIIAIGKYGEKETHTVGSYNSLPPSLPPKEREFFKYIFAPSEKKVILH